jgi:hypothetical protein
MIDRRSFLWGGTSIALFGANPCSAQQNKDFVGQLTDHLPGPV